MARQVELPAPARGAYDRALSRVERHAQHRERLLLAAVQVLKDGELTVAKLVKHAGVSRSTFYEFFDGPEHLIAQVEHRFVQTLNSRLDAVLRVSRMPPERLRAVARAWVDAIDASPLEARVALTRHHDSELLPRPSGDVLSSAGQSLLVALTRVAREAHDIEDWTTEETNLLAASAAVEAVTQRHLQSPLRNPDRVLSDIILRLLR